MTGTDALAESATLDKHVWTRLESARVRWLAVTLGLVVCIPSLGIGWITDDHAHRLYITSHLTGVGLGAWWDMFDVAGRGGPVDIAVRAYAGLMPWWASPNLSLAFLRPVSVVTHYADYLLWPTSPALMHAHNLAWYGVLVLLVAALYRRLLGPGVAAGLGAVLYAIDDAHAEAVAWIAARNTVMTAVFVVATLLAYDRARRNGSVFAYALSLLALALALGSSEGSIAVWAYLLPYALWLDPARPRARALWLSPLVLLTVTWNAVYRLLGFGVHGSGVYVDPAYEPGRFAAFAVSRLPEVLREQLALPYVFYFATPDWLDPYLDVVSYALVAAVAWLLLRRLRDRPELGFWATGMLLSALPVCALPVTPRLLFMTGLGAFAIVGTLVAEVFGRSAGHRSPVLAGTAGALLVVHVGVAAVHAPFTPRRLVSHEAAVRRVQASLPSGEGSEDKMVLVANTSNYFLTLLARIYQHADGEVIAPVMHVLGSSRDRVLLNRVDENTLRLVPDGGYLREPWSHMMRSPDEAFTPGHTIVLHGLRVVVEDVTSDGRPARVRLEFDDANDPRLQWIAWNGALQRYEPVTLPEIGRAVALPSSAGDDDDVKGVKRWF